MPLTLLSMARFASSMSSPNSKEARTMETFSAEVDSISFNPSMPSMASSMGSVTSLSDSLRVSGRVGGENGYVGELNFREQFPFQVTIDDNPSHQDQHEGQEGNGAGG